jgi:hypothetical protein
MVQEKAWMPPVRSLLQGPFRMLHITLAPGKEKAVIREAGRDLGQCAAAFHASGPPL